MVQEGKKASLGHGWGGGRVRQAAVQRARLRQRGVQLHQVQGKHMQLSVGRGNARLRPLRGTFRRCSVLAREIAHGHLFVGGRDQDGDGWG